MNKLLSLFFGSVFFQHLAYGISIPVIILWQSQNGLDFVQIGFLQSIGFAILIFSEIPSSFLADKVGRRFTSIIGLIFSLLSFGVLIFAHDFLTFSLYQILLSFGLSFLSGTEEAFLHDILGNDDSLLTKKLGIMSIYDEVGTIIGMLLSSILISFFTIEISFLVGFFALFFSVLLVVLMKLPLEKTVSFELKKYPQKFFLGLPIFLLFIAFAFMAERGQMVFQSAFDFQGIDLGKFGLVYVFAKIFSIFGSWFSQKIEDAFSMDRVFYLSAFLQMAAFGILLMQSLWISIFALALFSFAENVFRNIQKSLILKTSSYEKRATNLSLVSFGSSIFLMLFQPILGYSLDASLMHATFLLIVLKLLAFFLFFVKVRVA